jgi:23S rRNA-/tRNA-specific pseudouridylate synthase
VHLANEQRPIVGDTKYVGRKRAKVDPLWCPRQFLHAAVLEFKHPKTNKQQKFAAKLPADLIGVLEILQT